MLEICFNNSVKGALTLAQNCAEKSIGGAVGFITDKKGVFSFFEKRKLLKEYTKRQAELQKVAVSLGGKKEDIVGISFGLSQGDIKSPLCLEDYPRKDSIRSMFSFNRRNEQVDTEASISKFWADCINDLHKLESNSLPVRVWLDCTPDAQCGLLFLANLLKDSKPEIHIVELPQRITREDNSIVVYSRWGEIAPELYGTFLDNERVLTEKELIDLSDKWELLKAENSPLRVVENGWVISVDISYYDNLIRKEFPENACKISDIIISSLNNQKLPTSDIFIAKRIQYFIAHGELIVSSKTNDGFYSTIVSPAK